mgnify:FL=1
MKLKTSELTGAALDWAVAVCLGAVWQPKSARASFFIWPGTPVKYSANGGPTPLVAAMRCYVASKLGDEVDVPEELMK